MSTLFATFCDLCTGLTVEKAINSWSNFKVKIWQWRNLGFVLGVAVVPNLPRPLSSIFVWSCGLALCGNWTLRRAHPPSCAYGIWRPWSYTPTQLITCLEDSRELYNFHSMILETSTELDFAKNLNPGKFLNITELEVWMVDRTIRFNQYCIAGSSSRRKIMY